MLNNDLKIQQHISAETVWHGHHICYCETVIMSAYWRMNQIRPADCSKVVDLCHFHED